MPEPLIDPVTFQELQDSTGADFVVELVDTFLEEAPAMLQALRDALDKGDADAFRRAAHSLKSNGQTFGAQGLAGLARELELGGLPASPAPLAALALAYEQAAAALKALCHG
jgi:histidine phosphotransfer protein HptB